MHVISGVSLLECPKTRNPNIRNPTRPEFSGILVFVSQQMHVISGVSLLEGPKTRKYPKPDPNFRVFLMYGTRNLKFY